MNKKVLETVLKTILWCILAIVLLFGAAISVVVWVLTPEKLTPIVEDTANGFLENAHCDIERVELTVWRTFPQATIQIDGATLVSDAFSELPSEERALLPTDADTLLALSRFRLGVNLLAATTGKIAIDDVMLDALKVNAVAHSSSVANWNITAPSTDSDTTSAPLNLPDIAINSVEIRHCKGLRYFSLADTMDATMNITAAQLKTSSRDNMQFLFNSNVSLEMAGEKMLKALPIDVNGLIKWSASQPMQFGLSNWQVLLGNAPLQFSTQCNLASPATVDSLDLKLGKVEFAPLKEYLPDFYSRIFGHLKTNLSAILDLSLTRPFNLEKDSIPSLDITFEVPKSYVTGPKGRTIDNLSLLAHASIDGENIVHSSVALKQLTASGNSINLSLKGNASHMLSNPHIDGELRCNADIADAIGFLRMALPFNVSGKVKADTKIDFKMSDITSRRYHNIGMKGRIALSNFSYSTPDDSITLFAHNANFDMGSKEKVTSSTGSVHSNLLRAHFDIDTLDVNLYGAQLRVVKGVSNAALSGKPPRKGSKTIPMGGVIRAERVQYTTLDSSRIALNDIECMAISRNSDHSPRPTLNFNIKATRGLVINSAMKGFLRDADINLSLTPRERNANSRFNRRLDSLARIYPTMSRDSLLVIARNNNRRQSSALNDKERLDLSVDTATRGLLRRWSLDGSLIAHRASMFTPYFPLRNSISGLDIKFSTDSVIVNSGKYAAGRSSFDVSGGVRNLRSALMGNTRRPLLVNFNINSDTLDVNELIMAAYAGTNYILSDSTILITESESDMMENVDTTVTAFIIPRNVDMDIDVTARTGFYSDLKLRNLGGCLQMHNGALHLNNIHTQSDAGSISMDALYATTNRDSIHFAVDMSMDSVYIGRFIDMVPAVYTLMPLLKSMSGIIKADIAATADIDTSMNIIMPTLTAALKLHGDSLVLFDSETFATLSKMLMFKNKKRNMIDNMNVQMTVKDNVMQLYPFMFHLDRYKIGVMGNNDFDLNLNYHVSVLKSPIPFKFGVNIRGNADNMKFSMGKARFKEGEVGASVAVVDAQRINLRHQIENAFRNGASAALNSRLDVSTGSYSMGDDNLSHADSLKLIEQGLIENTTPIPTKEELAATERKKKAARKEAQRRRKREEAEAMRRAEENLKNGVGGY